MFLKQLLFFCLLGCFFWSVFVCLDLFVGLVFHLVVFLVGPIQGYQRLEIKVIICDLI